MTAVKPNKLSRKLREHREELGILQIDVAEKLGVSQQTVARWEAGLARPSRNLADVAKFLDLTASEAERLSRQPDLVTVTESAAGSVREPLESATLRAIVERIGEGTPLTENEALLHREVLRAVFGEGIDAGAARSHGMGDDPSATDDDSRRTGSSPVDAPPLLKAHTENSE